MVTLRIVLLLVCIVKKNVDALSFPGPRVYVVTPSPRPFQVDNANSDPFYYHSWMRRMDSEEKNTTSTTTTPKVLTPDLIFAEFESDGGMKKSIRKLLEKERIVPTSSTTSQPIYVPDEDSTRIVNYGLPVSTSKEESETPKPEMYDTNYFAMNKNLYKGPSVPVYIPTTKKPATATATTSTTTTSPVNVENIWHIIDNEKFNQHSGNWDEVSLDSSDNKNEDNNKFHNGDGTIAQEDDDTNMDSKDEGVKIDDNFALPGFGTNPGSGAENESRAIRTEPSIRFPYVNLKPFQMKNLKKPIFDILANSKKGNDLYTNLDNFFDLKKPVRGEAQDVGSGSINQPIPNNQPIDRYNPAQPYLPQAYGSKGSKPAPPVYSPPKTTANLVPPPPPPPSKGNDFPAPVSYESFPPYALSGSSDSVPMQAPAAPPVLSPPVDTPPSDTAIDSYSGPSSDDGPPMDIGYRYKPPSAPSPPQFLPTIPPLSKPFKGYSYDKPAMPTNNVPMTMDDMPDFQGYDYSKPSSGFQTPDHPSPTYDSPPSYGSSDSGPSYGHDSPPDHHDSDYPELIFNKHHGHMGDASGGDMKGADVGMMAPPDMKPESYGATPDDHGFPSDFPGDFKFHHDFDEHDHYHEVHHHEHTTTTETPRVNRFSYYYLGKKLYYLPLYFSVYFIVYVGALIIKAVLRHKIVYPNSWRPNTTTASFFTKRSVDEFLSNDNLHEMTGRVTHAIATAAEKYMKSKKKLE